MSSEQPAEPSQFRLQSHLGEHQQQESAATLPVPSSLQQPSSPHPTPTSLWNVTPALFMQLQQQIAHFEMQHQQQQSGRILDGIPPISIRNGLRRMDSSSTINSLTLRELMVEEVAALRQPVSSPPAKSDNSEGRQKSVSDSPDRALALQQNAPRSLAKSSSRKPISPQPPIKPPPSSTKRNKVLPAGVQRRRPTTIALTSSRRRAAEDAMKKANGAKQRKLLGLFNEETDDDDETSEKKSNTKEKTQRISLASPSHSDSDDYFRHVEKVHKKMEAYQKSSPTKKEQNEVKLKLPSTGSVKKKKDTAPAASPLRLALPQVAMTQEHDQPCDYVFCSKPKGDVLQWIQCDDCEYWFHSICVFGPVNVPQRLPEKFQCGCKL